MSTPDDGPSDKKPVDDPPSDDMLSDDGPSDEGGAGPIAPEASGADTSLPDLDGEILFHESGGSWLVVLIGPLLVGAVLLMEILGPGQVHWPVLMIFLVVIGGFSVLQVYAARRHVGVTLTETTLEQGTRRLPLTDIVEILPANNGSAVQDWESAPALGELHAVPRRRKGIGVELVDGKLAQAWARDVDGLRRELTEAHLAARLGLPPRTQPQRPESRRSKAQRSKAQHAEAQRTEDDETRG